MSPSKIVETPSLAIITNDNKLEIIQNISSEEETLTPIEWSYPIKIMSHELTLYHSPCVSYIYLQDSQRTVLIIDMDEMVIKLLFITEALSKIYFTGEQLITILESGTLNRITNVTNEFIMEPNEYTQDTEIIDTNVDIALNSDGTEIIYYRLI